MILVHVRPTRFLSVNPMDIMETPRNGGCPTIKIMPLGGKKADTDKRLLMAITGSTDVESRCRLADIETVLLDS